MLIAAVVLSAIALLLVVLALFLISEQHDLHFALYARVNDVDKCAEAAHARLTKALKEGVPVVKSLTRGIAEAQTAAAYTDRRVDSLKQRLNTFPSPADVQQQLRDLEQGMIRILVNPAKASREFNAIGKQNAKARVEAGKN